jgi:hypothetical protein
VQNVEMTVQDGKLVITIDLAAQTQPSASGKTEVIASTRGNARAPGDRPVFVGLNVYQYPSAPGD